MNQVATERIVRVAEQSSMQQIGRLLHSAVDVAIADNFVWIRYSGNDADIRSAVRLLHGTHFQLTTNGRLIPDGNTIATERLPELQWMPIGDVVQLQLPIAAMAGKLQTNALPQLQLLRGGEERRSNAALVDLQVLLRWCERVPSFRLRKLSASVAGEHVLVLGEPLPPVPCRYLCHESRLLTPAGMTWFPRIESPVVLSYFDVQADEYLLWTENDAWSIVAQSQINPLRLASLRAYAAERNAEAGAS